MFRRARVLLSRRHNHDKERTDVFLISFAATPTAPRPPRPRFAARNAAARRRSSTRRWCGATRRCRCYASSSSRRSSRCSATRCTSPTPWGIWQLLVVVKARSPDVARHLGRRYSSTFQAIGHVVHLLITVVIMLIAWQVREAARAAYGIPDEASTPLHYITLYYIASRTRRAQHTVFRLLLLSSFVPLSRARPPGVPGAPRSSIPGAGDVRECPTTYQTRSQSRGVLVNRGALYCLTELWA